MLITHEKLSDQFEKWKMVYGTAGTPGYFHSIHHHFTGPDKGGLHSHPWPFKSYLLAGSYIERVYYIDAQFANGWASQVVERKAGDKPHHVATKTIHEIIELPEGECWTVAVPDGPAPVPWYFWRFDESGIYRRLSQQAEFTKYTSDAKR